MEGTLGLRASPTALQGLRLIFPSQVRLDSGPAWEEKLFPQGGAVQLYCVYSVECARVLKYEHNTAELVSARGSSLDTQYS